MTTPTALPTDQEPTHHLTLETPDGLNKIGLYGCDAAARRNDRAIIRTPLSRSGIKIAQGQSEHSDLLPPFTEIEQTNWSAGIGLLDLKDRERYYHGENLDTSQAGKMFLGPLPVPLSGGIRNVHESMWGSCQWIPIYGTGRRRYARDFTATTTFDADLMATFVRRSGSPADLTVRLRSDSSGEPGTVLQTVTLNWETLNVETLYGIYVKADFSGTQSLTASTMYWFEVEADSSDDETDHWEILAAGATSVDNFNGGLNTSVEKRRPDVRFTNRRMSGPGSVLTDPPLWSLEGTDCEGVINPQSNLRLYHQNASAGYSFAVLDGWLWNVRADAYCKPASAAGEWGVFCRYVDVSNWVAAIASPTTIYLRSMVAGTPTNVTSKVYAWGTGYRTLSLRQMGNTFVVAVDGVDELTGTVAGTEYTKQGCLVNCDEDTSAYFDTFCLTSASGWRHDGSDWVPAEYSIRYRVMDTAKAFKGYFFDYKGGSYLIKDFEDNSTPKLYSLNSDRGVATGTQSSTTLQDTTKALSVNGLVGTIIKITGGPGKGQWRVVASNTATTFTVDGKPWRVTPVSGSSEYVVGGGGWAWEITGHGLTGPITDVLVSSKDVVYIAQGDSVNIRRTRQYNNAGAWTFEYADDGTNKATFIEEWPDEELGYRIARVNNVDANSDLSLSEATTPVWGTDLAFGTAIIAGRRNEVATAAVRYGDPEKIWVMKEGGFGRVLSGFFSQAPLREIETAASELNGVATLVHNLYLYTSFGRGGMERYYQDRFDDMGPNKDDGPPYLTAGPIAAAIGYPGRFFASTGEFNWPTDKLAGIYKYNGQGWHPYYTHYELGAAINSLFIQVLPGAFPDKLWFSAGGELVAVDLPSERIDPTSDDAISYNFQGRVILPWNYFDYRDAAKFFDKLKISSENLLSGIRYVSGRYNSDDGTGWHDLTDAADQSPYQDLTIDSADGHQDDIVQGRRLMVSLILNTEDRYSTPVINALVTSGVVFLDTKYRQDMTFKIADEMVDLEGDEEQIIVAGVTITSPTAEQKAALLEGWASSGQVLILRNIFSPYDNHVVSIDPESLKPWLVVPDDQLEIHVGQIGFVELR
jgi:hypothetical protein